MSEYLSVQYYGSGSLTRRFYRVLAERDGDRCDYCWISGTETKLVADHVHPRVQGGTDDLDNLVLSCVSCNSRKGGRTPYEWRESVRNSPYELPGLWSDEMATCKTCEPKRSYGPYTYVPMANLEPANPETWQPPNFTWPPL